MSSRTIVVWGLSFLFIFGLANASRADEYEAILQEALERFGDQENLDPAEIEEFLKQREDELFSRELGDEPMEDEEDLLKPAPDAENPELPWIQPRSLIEGLFLKHRPLAVIPKPAHTREEYCQAARAADYFRGLIQSSNNQMAFHNHGGIANGGVCWWHSRFQRSSTYLTVFRPDLPAPDQDALKRILTTIISNKDVVEVPGSPDLHHFSATWRREIQSRLERWQLIDAFLWQAWINGLMGRTSVSARSLRKKMDELYHEVEELQRISYVKLQVPGIPAHAWLVVKMTQRQDGYDLGVVDSNFPGRVIDVDYRDGDRHFREIYGKYVPYLQRTKDFRKFKKAIRRYCE